MRVFNRFGRTVTFLIIGLANALAAQALSGGMPFDISAGAATTTLKQFATQAHLQLLFDYRAVQKLRTPAVKGQLSPTDALKEMLEGSGFTFREINDHTIAITAPGSATSSTGLQGQPNSSTEAPKEGKTDPSSAFLLAQAASGQAASTASVAQSTAQQGPAQLQEVIVTAQKREERLQDVPTSITAISGDRLESLQITSLSDLSGYVPGLTISSYGAPGSRNIAIRGLNVAGDQAGTLVGTYVDDVPVGSSTAAARGTLFGLDLVPHDVADVEVLKGPQGTLYGANAMAGLIKYSLIMPQLTTFDARVGGESSYVNDSGKPDWSVRGALNTPLVPGTLAARVSGFYTDTAGFIDNIGIGDKNSNHSTESGGRAVLLWQPTDKLSVRATILGQDIDADDLTAVNLSGTTFQPLYGPQSTKSAFPQPTKQQTRLYSLHVNWNLDFAELSNTAGWSSMHTTLHEDFSVPYAALGALLTGDNSYALSLYEIDANIQKFVDEVRLTSRDSGRLQWMVGGYYTREQGSENDNWPGFTASYVPLPASENLFISSDDRTYKEGAVFANVTYKFTDRFDVGAGDRYSRYTQDVCQFSTGVFGTNALTCTDPPSTSVSTWMTDARLHLTADDMLYARVATGYRPGTNSLPLPGVPPTSSPDKTTNYEMGMKGQFLDRRVDVDIAAFYIDWSDIQLQALTKQGNAFIGNGGSASSEGVEAATIWQATDDLRLNATLAYTNAKLTQDAPLVGAKDGDQLPFSARWIGSVTADYRHPIDDHRSLLLGGGYRYRDWIVNQFPGQSGPPANPAAPSRPQNILDLYTGIAAGQLTIRLDGRNVLNNRSYAGAIFINDVNAPRYVPILPRTFGISIDYLFQ